jgi:hypothetical protein
MNFPATNAVPEIRDIMEEEPNVGIAWASPCFEFRPSPTEIVKDSKTIDVSVVSFLVMTDVTASTNPGTGITEETKASPVYCLFYWAGHDQIWLPGGFGNTYSGQHKPVYLF